jgi:DNA-directed RNA polymerase subunit RPC12/RpoP
MTLRENGKSKRLKIIKCDNCRERFDLHEEDIVKTNNVKFVECPYCGQDILLK